MKNIIIRLERLESVEELTYEERGKLFTLLLFMGSDELTDIQQTELMSLLKLFNNDRFLKQAFLPFKADFEGDRAKYERVSQRNRENGKKGGRPRKNAETQTVLKLPQLQENKTQKTSMNGLSMINLNSNIEKEKERESPLLDDILLAAQQCMIDADVATRFFYYYDSIGWKVGDRPIVNWKSKLMEWKNNPKTFDNASTHTDHGKFVANRTKALAEATLGAIQSSARGDAEEFDYSIL